MKITYLFLAIFLFALISCKGEAKLNNLVTLSDSIPADAIPFEYDEKMMKMIIFKGKLNDTISVNAFFDTGWTDISTVSDSLLCFVSKNNELRIGQYIKNQNINSLSNKNELFRYIGQNGIFINWRFFEGKILKISYKRKYIQELANINELTDYDSVKIRDGEYKRYLIVPVRVHMQGKSFSEDLLLDTGSNSSVFLDSVIVNKYSLNMDSAKYGNTSTVKGLSKIFWLEGDSIGISSHTIPDKNARFAPILKKDDSRGFSGLLGNSFLENFDIVLDLKNFVLYFKPIEK